MSPFSLRTHNFIKWVTYNFFKEFSEVLNVFESYFVEISIGPLIARGSQLQRTVTD
jgi:hypothetical protein